MNTVAANFRLHALIALLLFARALSAMAYEPREGDYIVYDAHPYSINSTTGTRVNGVPYTKTGTILSVSNDQVVFQTRSSTGEPDKTQTLPIAAVRQQNSLIIQIVSLCGSKKLKSLGITRSQSFVAKIDGVDYPACSIHQVNQKGVSFDSQVADVPSGIINGDIPVNVETLSNGETLYSFETLVATKIYMRQGL